MIYIVLLFVLIGTYGYAVDRYLHLGRQDYSYRLVSLAMIAVFMISVIVALIAFVDLAM